MMNNNKILTVSYGTFSCTLEGFDDSFGTMKAIAEYFRDLSAGDRYFGAEPPQPDAQMLAHIAKQEISRHVEAHEDDGRIVLKAQSWDEVAAPAQAQPDAEPASEKPAEVAPAAAIAAPAAAILAAVAADDDATAEDTAEQADVPHVEADGVLDIVPGQPDAEVEAFFADSPTDDFVDDATDANAAVSPAAAENIAQKLQRIRAVVSKQADEDAAPEYTEDEHAEAQTPAIDPLPVVTFDEDTAEDDDETQTADAGHSEDVLQETLREIDGALQADDQAEALAEDAVDAAADDIVEDVTADADADSVDDKSVDADDDTAPQVDQRGTDDLAALLSETPEAEVSEYEIDDETADEASSEDDISAILSRLAQDGAADTDDLADEAPEAQDDIAGDNINNLFGDEVAADAADGADTQAADSAEAVDEVAADDPESDATSDDAATDDADAPRVRVVKVKRADLEAAIDVGTLEEYQDLETSSLSDEDEAELARELAEVSAELQAEADADDAAERETPVADETGETADEDDAAEDADAIAARHMLPDLDEDMPEGDVSRLMAKTDSQMGDAESAGRRDAFAHLRAAVAAKEADVAMGADTGQADEDGAYREDLASVVRPRRPVSAGRTARPGDGRPAPLKLVAEQRVDPMAPSNEGPVRPRRVAAAPAEQAIAAESGFAEFADEMGASKLPDLLEAAAAYMSYVEGRDQFSRPQLMTKVRQVEKDEFSREDGLRWFGKLLREGKIQKMKGGRFQVSDQIGFKPDARAAS